MRAGKRTPLVIKFGGTSLQDSARIRRAARRIAGQVGRGHAVVAVVSAMGATTDRILETLQGAGIHGIQRSAQARREADRALATGEDLSAALLAAALNVLGISARSLRGGEAGIEAVGEFGGGAIRRIDAALLQSLLLRGIVPVVSGFQGMRDDHETVTLGRGGSDTTAVAIAAALGGAPCDIVTDVSAVFDRDPREDATARPLSTLTHEELLVLSKAGAVVVHPEAARLAFEHAVPLRVYAFSAPIASETEGTRIGARS